MNKYEKELEKKEFFTLLLYGSNKDAIAFLKNKEAKSKIYYYTRLKNDLLKIKEKIENANNEKKDIIYSSNDIEFLKQFSGFDLTYSEAKLTGKTKEFYDYHRYISYIMGNENNKLSTKFDQEIKRLDDEYSPRLLLEIYNKYKKGSKN